VVKTIAEAPAANPQQVTPDYFRVMRIPRLSGRASPTPTAEARLRGRGHEAMARKFLARAERGRDTRSRCSTTRALG
jgi:hypothetical protein